MAAGGVTPLAPGQGAARVKTLAVFIDADNLNEPTALDHVLTDLRQRADRVLYKRAYGRAESLKGIESVLSRHGVRPVANMVVNKVTTDSALVIDAVEAVCTNRLDAVAICSGDADFVPLATWLREKGCLVWYFSLADRIFANPESFYDDVAVLEVVESPADITTPANDPAPAAVPAAAALHGSENALLPVDGVQRVLQAFPALLGGQPQQLNQVVSALRQAGVLGQGSKTVAWFGQHAPAFRLYPDPAPNRIVYTAGVTAQPAAAFPAASSPAEVAKADSARDKAAAVRGGTPLVALLRKAVLAARDGGGWAVVSAVRTQLGAKAQFDTRVYGYPTLTKLLEATAAFDLRDVGTPQVAVRAREQNMGQPAGAPPSAAAVTTWLSTRGRRASRPLPVPLHALRSVLLQVAAQRVGREDVLDTVPELATGKACALSAVAGRLREKGHLYESQSALRILERFPQHFEINLTRHPQSVRYLNASTA